MADTTETPGDSAEQPSDEQVEATPDQPESAAAEIDATPSEPEASPAELAAESDPPAPASEEAAAAEEPPAAEEPEAAAEEPPAAEEPEAETETPAAEEATPEPAAPAAPASDLPPGADLEPITLDAQENLSTEQRARLEAEEEERAQREASLASDTDTDEVVATSRTPAELARDGRYLATGKRKSAIARVTLVSGDGKFQINGRELAEFFPRPLHQTMARQPLAAAGYESNVDVRVRVHGGGISGQAGAVRHGIARALTEIDPELRGDLKRRGFLTRDPRVKERRKAGLKKARKRPQFSKR